MRADQGGGEHHGGGENDSRPGSCPAGDIHDPIVQETGGTGRAAHKNAPGKPGGVIVARARIELATFHFSGGRSTD